MYALGACDAPPLQPRTTLVAASGYPKVHCCVDLDLTTLHATLRRQCCPLPQAQRSSWRPRPTSSQWLNGWLIGASHACRSPSHASAANLTIKCIHLHPHTRTHTRTWAHGHTRAHTHTHTNARVHTRTLAPLTPQEALHGGPGLRGCDPSYEEDGQWRVDASCCCPHQPPCGPRLCCSHS